MHPKLAVVIGILCVAAGFAVHAVQTPRLPSWGLFSARDVSAISVQGWGPGASGTYIIHPAAGQSPALINSFARQLSMDKRVKTHATANATGGADWLVIQLKNGSSIEFANFPNEPVPIQYIVSLTDKSGKQESRIMISDVSGGVATAIQAISSRGVRQTTH